MSCLQRRSPPVDPLVTCANIEKMRLRTNFFSNLLEIQRMPFGVTAVESVLGEFQRALAKHLPLQQPRERT